MLFYHAVLLHLICKHDYCILTNDKQTNQQHVNITLCLLLELATSVICSKSIILCRIISFSINLFTHNLIRMYSLCWRCVNVWATRLFSSRSLQCFIFEYWWQMCITCWQLVVWGKHHRYGDHDC